MNFNKDLKNKNEELLSLVIFLEYGYPGCPRNRHHQMTISSEQHGVGFTYENEGYKLTTLQ